jgi:hypothetical protein
MASMVAQRFDSRLVTLRLHPTDAGADTQAGMDETFSFRAPPLPLRRRVNGRVVKGVAAAVVLLTVLALFTQWVVESERRSEARAPLAVTDEPMIGMMQGVPAEETAGAPSLPGMDSQARAQARTALEHARRALDGKGTIAEAGPGQLAASQRSLTFTDGPSPAPGIVSVAVAGRRWAAAVMGLSGTCYWVSLAPSGTSFGTGEVCTGVAALGARDPSWR